MLLPDDVAVVETAAVDPTVRLREGESVFVERAVERRRQEFAAGRAAAHRALAEVGIEVGTIPVGPNREPLWPDGTVGSITHCDGYVAAAVARDSAVRSVGIDAEPALPLPRDVIDHIALDVEQQRFGEVSPVGDRLLFSAKESIYKAWFPLTGRWLGFEDCEVTVTSDRARAGNPASNPASNPDGKETGSFTGVVDPTVAADAPDRFVGRYCIDRSHVLTAVVVPLRSL